MRLGYQGIELAETGRLTLPMPEPVRTHIVDVRVGKHTEAEVLDEARGLEKRLLDLRDAKVLPPPDRGAVERFVVDTYMERHARKR